METNNQAAENCVDEESVRNRTLLFNKYVLPNLNLVFKLCIQYSYYGADVEDNFNEVLINFYKYIETYDTSRSLQTWLHIVTKRLVCDLNNRKSQLKRNDDVDVYELAGTLTDEDQVSSNCMSTTNYTELYNDEILKALNQLKPIYRDALLLQQAGYKLYEIMEISYRNGSLKTKNIETIKSRLFLAKQQMRNLINRDGEARTD
ncbi:sigma-70 family RNA polymerase sigma factor [Dysgonomonas sp. ZJ709]|uniref:sigma-70 family RNA polymerase sigma factor n=1 Tax=Dysgonomonas sp. ZJ709 TaxID=2709797 RepID=UPI0013EAA944|nr:RNA polymerase sigma factor [Dysgonomonas sp. ZJ709]